MELFLRVFLTLIIIVTLIYHRTIWAAWMVTINDLCRLGQKRLKTIGQIRRGYWSPAQIFIGALGTLAAFLFVLSLVNVEVERGQHEAVSQLTPNALVAAPVSPETSASAEITGEECLTWELASPEVSSEKNVRAAETLTAKKIIVIVVVAVGLCTVALVFLFVTSLERADTTEEDGED